jgi:hypothetical protein
MLGFHFWIFLVDFTAFFEVDPPPWHLHHCQGTLKKANWNKNLYTSF